MFAIDLHYRVNPIRGRRGIDIPETRRGFDFEVELRETGNGCLVLLFVAVLWHLTRVVVALDGLCLVFPKHFSAKQIEFY